MNTIKKFAVVLMVAVASVSAFAVENWVTVDIEANKGDKNPGPGSFEAYTAYYCTKAAAKDMFGVDTYTEVANYLKNNYDTGWKALEDGAKAGAGAWLLDQEKYGLGQYSFTAFMLNPPEEGNYLALVSYNPKSSDAAPEVDVLSGSASGSGEMVFDDLGGSPSSGWTQTVPEPTSGMLLLLGFAALSLRRKDRE